MDSSLISWIITGVIAFIIMCGVLFGAIRGLKKTAIRGIWLLVTAILVYFFAALITKGLTSINISFLGLEGSNGTATSLKDAIAGFLNNQYGADFAESNADLIQAIFNLIPMLISPIIFTLLFWILKYLLLPLNAIFTRVVFPNAKQKFKREQKRQRKLARQSTYGFADNFNGDEEITPIENNISPSSLEEIRNNQYTGGGNINIENSQLNDYFYKLDQLKRQQYEIKNGDMFIQQHKTKKQAEEIIREQNVEQPSQPQINTQQEQPNYTSNGEVNTYQPNNQGFVANNQTNNTQNVDQQNPQQFQGQPQSQQNNQQTATIVDYAPVVKKHRAWGMLVGLFVGLFICCCTLVPINGILNATKEINKHKALLLEDETKHEQGYLTALTDGKYDEIVKIYTDSIGAKVLKYTGIEAVSTFGFNNLAVTKKDKIKVKLSSDIKNIMSTLDTAGRLTQLDGDTLKTYTVAQLDGLIKDVEKLINDLFNINLLNYAGTFGIDVVLEIFDEEQVKEMTGNNNTARIVNSALDSVRTMANEDSFQFKSLKSEVMNIVDIFKAMNKPEPEHTDNSLLRRIINNDFDKPLVIINDLGSDYVKNIIKEVFEFKLAKDVLPVTVNTLLSALYNSENLGDFEENQITIQDIQGTFNTIIDACFDVFEEIDLEANNIENALTKETDIFNVLSAIGSVIDNLKDTYLTEVSYQKAINKLKTLALDAIEKELKDNKFSGVVDQIKNILNSATSTDISWGAEISNIATAIKFVKDKNIITQNKDNTGIKFNMPDLNLFGELLDGLEVLDKNENKGVEANSKLFNFTVTEGTDKYNIMGKIVAELLEYAKEPLGVNNSDDKLNNVINEMKNNVLNDAKTIDDTPKNINWENAFNSIQAIYETIKPIIDDASTINTPTKVYESKLLQNLGKTLNNNQNSLFLKGVVINNLVSYGLDIIKDKINITDETISNAIKGETGLITSINENISTATKINWQNEFNVLHELIGLADIVSDFNNNSENLANIGKTIDSNKDRQIISDTLIKNLLADTLDKVISFDANSDDTIKKSIDLQLNDIKSRLQYTNENINDEGILKVDSWETEFTCLLKLSEIDFNNISLGSFDYTDTTDEDESKDGIGATLDEVMGGKIITFSNIKNILSAIIEDKFSNLDPALNNNVTTAIENNISGWNLTEETSFNEEFKCIQVYIDLADDLSTFDDTANSLNDNTIKKISKRLNLTRNSQIVGNLGITVMSTMFNSATYKYKLTILAIMEQIDSTNASSDHTTLFDSINSVFETLNTTIENLDYSTYFEDLKPIKNLLIELGEGDNKDTETINGLVDTLTNSNEFINESSKNILNKYFKSQT